MPTRRDMLRLAPAPLLMRAARAAEGPDFERIDTHIHIHRDAPALLAASRTSNWQRARHRRLPGQRRRAVRPRGEARRHAQGPSRQRRHAGLGLHLRCPRLRGPGLRRPHDRPPPPVLRRRGDRREDLEEHRHGDQGEVGRLPPARRSRPAADLRGDRRADRTLVAHLAEPDGAWLPLDDKNPEITYYSKNPQWHMFGKPGRRSRKTILTARDRVLARYPKLAWSGCHLGSDEDDLGRLAKRLDAYPNFAVDTAARVRYFARGDREQVRAVPDPVPGPHPLRHRLRPARRRPGGRGEDAAGHARPRLGLLLRRRHDGVRRPADAGAGTRPTGSCGRSSARTPSAGCPASASEGVLSRPTRWQSCGRAIE